MCSNTYLLPSGTPGPLNLRESESYAGYLERRGEVCRDCEKAAFVAGHQAKVEAAAVDPTTAAMPTLVGTELIARRPAA